MDKKTETPQPLRFKPLSEGLGINHFADGLPYSPVSQGKRTMMQFQTPVPRTPRYGAQENKTPNALPQSTTPAQNFSPLTTPQSVPEKSTFIEIGSLILKLMLASVAATAVLVAGFWLNGLSPNSLFAQAPMLLFSLYGVITLGFLAVFKLVNR